VFSRDGYVEARVEDIARAAGVAPTAIYYHFGGKDELFTQALRTAMAGFSERIYQARPDFEAPNVEGLRKVLAAGWDYFNTHPDEARLVLRYSEGRTPHALSLRQEWEERHLQRAYDYVPSARTARSTRKANSGLFRYPSKKCSASRKTSSPAPWRNSTESLTMATASSSVVRNASVTW